LLPIEDTLQRVINPIIYTKADFVTDNEPPSIWPDPDRPVRGEFFLPLYKSLPVAASNDSMLYELLSLVDAIRGDRARDREIAKKELKKRLDQYV